MFGKGIQTSMPSQMWSVPFIVQLCTHPFSVISQLVFPQNRTVNPFFRIQNPQFTQAKNCSKIVDDGLLLD